MPKLARVIAERVLQVSQAQLDRGYQDDHSIIQRYVVIRRLADGSYLVVDPSDFATLEAHAQGHRVSA